jgi:hypothetical protein
VPRFDQLNDVGHLLAPRSERRGYIDQGESSRGKFSQFI